MKLVTRVASAVLLGIPGLSLFAYAANELIASRGSLSTRAVALLAFLGGAILALIGFGKIRQPLYAACYLPIPFLLVWTIELEQMGSWLHWLTGPAIGLWPVLIYTLCERYYERMASLDENDA
jgi:hypothetical protein